MVSLGAILSVAAALTASFAAAASQERPMNWTICDYYTNKTVGSVSPENNRILMALVLHSALLGPFSKYNSVPVANFTGALTSTTFLGEAVDLNPYFNGALKSANTGSSEGEAVNFFDDGGLDAARDLKPSNGNTSSAQNIFFTHVYSYFATFLGCSHIDTPELPKYAGRASMYEVHKYMDLNWGEMSFFIDQAVRGLISIGFDDVDAQFVNTTLNGVFNFRCAPAATVVPESAGNQLQAICIASDCPLSPNDTCTVYETSGPPAIADPVLLGNYTKKANGTTVFNTSSPSTGQIITTSQAYRTAVAGSSFAGIALTMSGAMVFAFILA